MRKVEREKDPLYRLWKRFKRWRYVRAMMRAIDEARTSRLFVKQVPKTFGLRVIKTFERVNGVPFNPFYKEHVSIVSDMGHFEYVYWCQKMVTKWVRRVQS